MTNDEKIQEAREFLKKEGIIAPKHTSFWIQYEDGSQIELTRLLAKFKTL